MREIEIQQIGVDKQTLGGALRNGPLHIPPYQREYAWKPDRVRKLFDDFNRAKLKNRPSYFLGTIVLTPGRPLNVIDGQQRLATTCIMLAAIRDTFLSIGRTRDAESIEKDFLWRWDREAGTDVPTLLMNLEDRAYMWDRVILRPGDRQGLPPTVHSHRRINRAAGVSAERVAGIVAGADSVTGKVDLLNSWIDFVDHKALVVMLTPPTNAGAFQVFKTQNDRAQQTTQADMIKNHLFEQADDAIDEAMSKWSTVRSTIEGIGASSSGDEDPLLFYLHQVGIVLNGPIKSDDVFEYIEENVSGRANAMSFMDSLARLSNDFAAIATPTHPKWGAAGYQERVRDYVGQISGDLKGMSFIRPLMLAIAAKFAPKEANRAFVSLVSWVVRFLIAGGSRGGRVMDAIANAAKAVNGKKIVTTAELTAYLLPVIPNDTKFREAFLVKTITSSRQARFILFELETQKRLGNADEHIGPSLDPGLASLEHILPKNLSARAGWSNFTPDDQKVYRYRLGNLVLMNTKDNGAAGDKPFSEKRPFIEKSANIRLTAMVIDLTKTKPDLWGRDQINERQKMLAELAVARWPVDPHQKKRKRK